MVVNTNMDYRQTIRDEASRQGLDPNLAEAMMTQESSGNASAVSPKGAQGLTQLMPATARDLGVDPTDPQQNIRGGVSYLKQQVDRFGTARGLAAYNAGPGRVARTADMSELPSETQNYVSSVLSRAQRLAAGGGAPAPEYSPGQVDVSHIDIDTLMSGFQKARSAGDAKAVGEISAVIQHRFDDALSSAKAAGDDDAVNEISHALARFVAPGNTDVVPQPQNGQEEAPKPLARPAPTTFLGKVARTADNFVRGVADTATFGYADELAAWVDSHTGGGQTGKTNYDDALKAQRAIDAQADQQEHGRTVGQVTGAVIAPGAALRAAKGASVLTRIGVGAATGGVQGALYGSGSATGDLDSRIQGAEDGAEAGAIIGGLLPVAGVGLRAANKALGVTQGARVANAIERAGSDEGARIDAEIAQRLGDMADNPNFRGQPIRAEQLNNVSRSFIQEATDAVQTIGAKEIAAGGGDAKAMRGALQNWRSLSNDDINALRGSSLGDSVADSIVKAQRVRSLTAEQEALGGVVGGLAKVGRVGVSLVPLPAPVHYMAKALLGSAQSRKATTAALLTPRSQATASAVLDKLGPSQASQAGDTLQSLVAAARTRQAAATAAKTATSAASRAPEEVAMADLQAKDPTYMLGLGNKLGAPRNDWEMGEFSSVLRDQMARRAAQEDAEKAAQEAGVPTTPDRLETFTAGQPTQYVDVDRAAPISEMRKNIGPHTSDEVLAHLQQYAADNPEMAKHALSAVTEGGVVSKKALSPGGPKPYYVIQNELQRKFGNAPEAPAPAPGKPALSVAPDDGALTGTFDGNGDPIKNPVAYGAKTKARVGAYDKAEAAMSELSKPAQAAGKAAVDEMRTGSPRNADAVLAKVEQHLAKLSPGDREAVEAALGTVRRFYQ